jgi:hypothetical protein
MVRTRQSAQKLLFSDLEEPSIRGDVSSTFVENMNLPVHRWFRYSAGFSAKWAEDAIREAAQTGPVAVLDPFAGAGTTLLAAERVGVPSYGLEAHPLVARVARGKLLYRSDPEAYLQRARDLRRHALRLRGLAHDYPPLIHKCFSAEGLEGLDHLRRAWEASRDDTPASELVWLTIVAILRQVSTAGTAPWQYVLPRKAKKAPQEPTAAFDLMMRTILADMHVLRGVSGPHAVLIEGDARTCAGVPDGFASLVLTSPPYANNYDYADATRLEMCFLGEINGWGDLQSTVRHRLVRACSQHVPARSVNLEEALAAADLEPIREEIGPVCRHLARVRQQKGGKKTYHLMVACYFLDMAEVWRALRRACRRPARVCFVIGDSAPYGIYVPVVPWMEALAHAAGFGGATFQKTRDRNIKWKNRKHRVPLCEGRLWVDG